MEDDLLKHLISVGNLPYLFVGSGFSKRYIGMESWQDLLETICSKVGLPKPFTYYLTESSKDYPLLGGMISDAFYEIFYNSDYKTLYPFITDSDLKNGNKDTPLKYLIADYIKNKPISPTVSSEITLLKQSKIAGLITTNWDTLLEDIYPDFKKFIGQEMMFAETLNYGEIFKIHGCVTNPDSVVVTERDYADYHKRYAYLSAKLLTIFVEHPIIFIGYSLSDSNILGIINSIFTCINPTDHEKFKDRLIFVEFDRSKTKPTFMDGTLSVGNGTFLPIKHIKANDFSPVYAVLGKLQQTIPPKVLVRLKNMLYEFVVTNKPSNKIYVGDIANVDDSVLDKIQAVFGVGAAEMYDFGYRSIESEDIFKDVLSDDTAFDIDKLLSLSFPSVFKNIGYMPIHKYLKIKGLNVTDDLLTAYPGMDTRIISKLKRITFTTLSPPSNYAAHKAEINKLGSFKELTESQSDWHVLLYVQLLDHNKIDLDDFKAFLLRTFDAYYSKTEFRKAVCLYDKLKYS